MTDTGLSPAPDDPLRRALARTPARLLTGRAGPALRTGTWLKLREDHAAARDAVHAELESFPDFTRRIAGTDPLLGTRTNARTKAEYLTRPDLGRRFDGASRDAIRNQCPAGCDLQVVMGDGLSATAVAAHAPPLLDGLRAESLRRGWSFGRPFVVRFCRVGILNDVGDLLYPQIVVLLIGERPGLAMAESLSAYLAFHPRAGHTDADRNLISNIHAGGVRIPEAVERIAALADLFRELQTSGVAVKELRPVPCLPETQ